jgi:cell division protein FtsQ
MAPFAALLPVRDGGSDASETWSFDARRLMSQAGLGISEIALSGHRFTLDGEIYDQIGVNQETSLPLFDAAAAKTRIERLPWVERADVARVFPHRLEIKITERTPFAVWIRTGRATLIDATGRELGPVPHDAVPELPRISGEGANTSAFELLAALRAHADLANDVTLATRISGRRWRLTLSGGAVVELPATEEQAALARLVVARAEGPIAPHHVLDLRHPARTVVRAPRPDAKRAS